MKPILISLRGNAGSGKSTISRMLIDALNENSNVLYLELDAFRRHIVYAKKDDTFHEMRNVYSKSALKTMIDWGKENADYIILDGKFSTKHFTDLYEHILAQEIKVLAYWFDLSFEETARRHSMREKSKVFSAEEMKDWFRPQDLMPNLKEKLINEKQTPQEILDMILNDLGQ